MYHIKQRKNGSPNIENCSQLLSEVYRAEDPPVYEAHGWIPAFSLEEIRKAAKSIKEGKSADKSDIVIEMF